MKILYVLNSGDFGGMEKHVQDLCGGMVHHGHQVFVWCPPGENVENFSHAGARVTQAKIRSDIDPFYILKLAGFLKREKIDILHAHELKASVNALIAGKLAGTKIRITHTHTPISEWQISGWKKRLNLFIYPKIVNALATYEIALTPSRKDIKISEGIKEEKLMVLPSANAVSIRELSTGKNIREQYRNSTLAKLEIDPGSVIWGCLGRLTEEKGHAVLVGAFKIFIDGLPADEKESHKLILAGGGKLEGALKEKIKEYGLENKITITGTLSHQEVIKYYGTFDFFVHPSLAEGFGLVLIEAMAAGIPVIASDLAVFKEVGGDAVLYFQTGDAHDLARVMQENKDRRLELKVLVEKAHKRVAENFSLEKFVEGYRNFYLELQQK